MRLLMATGIGSRLDGDGHLVQYAGHDWSGAVSAQPSRLVFRLILYRSSVPSVPSTVHEVYQSTKRCSVRAHRRGTIWLLDFHCWVSQVFGIQYAAGNLL
jgi:hypothetical protein